MKYTSILAVALAATASATAEPEPWCTRMGQSCWKVRRAAEAFTESIRSSGGLAVRSAEADVSNLPGGASFFAKRAIDELAGIIAFTQDDPFAYYNFLDLDSQFYTDTNATAEKERRDADPAPWCTRMGQSCWKAKREAIAAAEAEAQPWCTRMGQSCWKRDAEADADPHANDKRWCVRMGQSCWKAKRAAEAVLSAVGEPGDELHGAPFDPKYKGRRDAEPEPWCTRMGQSCWKRNAEAEAGPWCVRMGQSCWKAKRDMHAIANAARSVIETFTE